MNILLFSDKKSVIKQFDPVHRSRTHSLEVFPLSDFKNRTKNNEDESICYIDISDLAEEEIKKTLRTIKRRNHCSFGIIDNKNRITDPAGLFHDGIADYIGKDLLREGVSSKRVNNVVDFLGIQEQAEQGQLKAEQTSASELFRQYNLSGTTWNNIKPGNEYTFCFMYTELDLHSDWREKSGRLHLDKVGTEFHNFIEKTVAPIGGKIWMWNDFNGLVLFPFDDTSCEAILTSFQLILNRSIISTENFNYQILLSYKIALDIGNTVYKLRGNTGTVISDTVNFLFHLGKRFAEPGNFYLTDGLFPFIPPCLNDYFLPAGTFEGKTISRMRLPLE